MSSLAWFDVRDGRGFMLSLNTHRQPLARLSAEIQRSGISEWHLSSVVLGRNAFIGRASGPKAMPSSEAMNLAAKKVAKWLRDVASQVYAEGA